MFGYIAPVLSVLSEEQKQRYRSFYCGVCHALRERHGQSGRLSLSNDMTFLAMLLSSLYEPETGNTVSRCGIHPVKSHAFLSSPMIAPYLSGIPVPVAAALGAVAGGLGKGKKNPFFMKPYAGPEDFATSCATDPRRFAWYDAIKAARPEFQNSTPSWQWIREAVHVTAKILAPGEPEKVACPAIKESPVQLECKVFEVKTLGSHDMFLADIVNIRVDESIINDKGRVMFEKLNLVSVIHGSYYAAPGARIGRMGYSVMKPSTAKKISAQQRAKHMARKQGKEKLDRG